MATVLSLRSTLQKEKGAREHLESDALEDYMIYWDKVEH